eukprot:scaffold4003_cov13-Tisochrysis_lutea.AAC.1
MLFCPSDHRGLSMVFKVGGSKGSRDSETEGNNVCKAGLCDDKLICVGTTRRLLKKFEAESAGDSDQIAFCMRLLIVQAASDRAVGMTSLDKCAFVRARKQERPLSPVWFGEQRKEENSLRRPQAPCIKE